MARVMNPQSFRTRLVLLLLLVIIPAGVLLLLSNVARLETEREKVREQTVCAAKLAAASQAYFVREARQLLATVIQTHPAAVLSTDRTYCEKRLATLRLLAPDFDDFGLIEPDGTLFCHTLGTNVERAKIVAPELLTRVIETHQFGMSDLHPDGPLGQPTLQFAYPIFDSKNNLVRLLYASLKLPLLDKALAAIPLPQAGLVRVTDRRGNTVAQNPRTGVPPESKHPNSFILELPRAISTNFFEAAAADGTKLVFAVSPVLDETTPVLSVHVMAPRKILFARADSEFGASLAGMMLIGTLVLALAWWYSKRAFVRPVTAMLSVTDRLANGDLSARTGITEGKSELHLLARRFDGMAETLAARQRELEKANLEVKKSNSLLELRVQERTRELATLNGELEAFCYSVSHDLRAPLRHMDGFARILVEEKSLESNPVAQRYLGSISKSAEKMGALIEDLLAFSRMARQAMSTTKIETNTMLNELIPEITSQELNREIEWNLGGLPAVNGDRSLIRQVWWNLLANAVKYTRGKEPAKIDVSATAGNDEIIFMVEDNGAGFDMRYADKLFGVFQRLHSENEFEGTASASRMSAASLTGMAAAPGPRANRAKARNSSFPSRSILLRKVARVYRRPALS